jgi:hypothetical protein
MCSPSVLPTVTTGALQVSSPSGTCPPHPLRPFFHLFFACVFGICLIESTVTQLSLSRFLSLASQVPSSPSEGCEAFHSNPSVIPLFPHEMHNASPSS